MATTKFNPTYRPFKTSHHALMGPIDHYRCDHMPRFSGCGAQAGFLVNNARPNCPREYGIKLFSTASQAFAAYQRQMIAAEAGAAPPVRRMVYFTALGMRYDWESGRHVRGVIEYWGYQTCLAYGIGRMEVPMEVEECDDASLIPDSGVRRLYRLISRLSIAGTQIDGKPLGTVRKRSKRMKHDLHEENLGFWRKRPVCIDFGHHIIQEAC